MLWLVCRRRWRLVNKALRVLAERAIECVLACGMNCIGLAVVHLVWSDQADPGVMMILIVPVEEAAAEAFGVLNAAEAFGEAGRVLQRLEMTFGERVVVGDVRPNVRPGNAEIGE